MFNISNTSNSSTLAWKTSRIGTLMWATALAAWCVSTPPSYNYAPPASRAPVVSSNYPSTPTVAIPTVISKQHTHNGPLGDRVCTFVYSNQERVLKLCDFKPGTTSAVYSKHIPGSYVQTPSTTQWIPPSAIYEGPKPELFYNPKTWKYEYRMTQGGVKNIPWVYKNIPWKMEYKPWKNIQCRTVQHFSQQNWAAMPKQEVCNG